LIAAMYALPSAVAPRVPPSRPGATAAIADPVEVDDGVHRLFTSSTANSSSGIYGELNGGLSNSGHGRRARLRRS
jgi:hypothetical protein